MSTKQIEKFATELEIPEGVTVTYKEPMITVQRTTRKDMEKFQKRFQLQLKLLMVKYFSKHKVHEIKVVQS